MRRSAIKYILILGMLLLPSSRLLGKSLELYYIAHDHYETTITRILEQVRRNARYNTDRTVIFYLANGNSPVRMLVSPNDEQDYDFFIEMLNSQTSHNVYPEVDRLMIMDMLSEGRFIPTKGFDDYDSVVFNYYITPGFISMDFCDALIGRLYWDMDMQTLGKRKLEINIFHNPDIRVDENKLFGRKNLIEQFPYLVDSF